MASLSVGEVVRILDARAPHGTAESWDNCGLLVGDPGWKTSGAVVSIDLTEKAIRTAVAKKVRLIVNHHPCIFPKSRGLSRVVADGAGTSPLVFEAIQQGIAVAAYHTNFDRCALEVVESVSKALGAKPLGRLVDHPSGSLVKLSVYVPRSHLEKVREAVCEAGAGQIGNYDCCSFGVEGKGTFRGGKDTDPFIGRPGTLEIAEETRFETVLPRGMERPVLAALMKAHPYEEVAYDLYPIEQAPSAQGLVRGLGYGFWGELEKPKLFSEVVKSVNHMFSTSGFLLTDPPPARIKRVAFVAGKGAAFVDAAAAAGCDLFITGEVGYHVALEGTRQKMAVMELGHRESERFFLSTMKGWLKQAGLNAMELNVPTQKVWAAH